MRLEHFADWLNGQWKNTSDHSNVTGWTNFFVAEICYVPRENRFEGRVAQNGVGSRSVGFQVGDLYWVATELDAARGTISGTTNFRYGANGVTHRSHWVPFEIRLAESSKDIRVEFADLRPLSEPPRIYRMARHGPAAACPEVAKPVFNRP